MSLSRPFLLNWPSAVTAISLLALVVLPTTSSEKEKDVFLMPRSKDQAFPADRNRTSQSIRRQEEG